MLDLPNTRYSPLPSSDIDGQLPPVPPAFQNPPITQPVSPAVSVPPEPVVPTPVAPEPPVMPNPPIIAPFTQVPAPPPVEIKKKKMPLIIGVVLAVIIIAAGVYFGLNYLTIPTKIKEKAQITQPVFEDYSGVIDQMVADIDDSTGGGDSASAEREAQKVSGLLKNQTQYKDTLQNSLKGLDLKQMAAYKQSIENYLSKANEMVVVEEDNLKRINAFIDVFKSSEKLQLIIKEGSNYMLSDPDRYISMLDEAIKELQTTSGKLQKADVGNNDLNKKIIAVYIDMLTAEIKFFEGLKIAVQNRSSEEVSAAELAFTQTTQDLDKESNRLHDLEKEQTVTLKTDLQNLKSKEAEEYSQLRSRYKF